MSRGIENKVIISSGIGAATNRRPAEAVAYAVGTPGTVAVSEILIRPTNQAI